MKFRKLRADEIDCRISTINSKGLSLLLYKDARCDMNILDEEVGAMHWQRSHSRDNANCTVSIYDSENKQWVSKEDTGTESYTEKEKGLASDSFKRACFNWGIGRELYTAPFIWISANNCNLQDKNGKKTCYDRFKIKRIEYDEKGCISQLVIINQSTNKEVFSYGSGTVPKTKDYTYEECMILIDKKKLEEFIPNFQKMYNVDDLHKLNQSQLNDFFNRLCKQPARS